MLAIRLQRTGRSGHAQFRVIVQEARLNPSSGKVVARLGNYNPHTKAIVVDKEKAGFYLEHGAQPSERVVSLLKKEGVKLPKWVAVATKKEGVARNPEKLRKNQLAKEPVPATEEKSDVVSEPAEAPEVEASAEVEKGSEPKPTDDSTPETTTEEPAATEVVEEALPEKTTEA